MTTSGANADHVEVARDSVTRAGLLIAALICASVVVSHIFGRFSYSVLLPAISDDLVNDYTGVGFLGASYFGGYLLGVIGVTAVSSRLEPITLLRTGLGLSVLALATIATAPEFSVLSSGIFFAGLAGAGIWIPAPALVTARLPDRHRGLAMAALTATMGLGMLLVSQGSSAYRTLADDDGVWREIFGIEVAVTLVILIVAVVFVRLPRTDAAVDASSKFFDLSGLASIPRWGLLAGSYWLFAALAGTWGQLLGVALEEDAGFSRNHISNVYTVFAVVAIPGTLVFGRLSDRVGRDRSISLAAGSCVFASILLPLWAEPFASIAAGVFGAGSFAVPPLTAAAVRDHLEGREFATAFGAMTVVYAAVSMAASQLAGLLADAMGNFVGVYLVLAVVAAVTALLARHRSRALIY